jgi:hypothetical protein
MEILMKKALIIICSCLMLALIVRLFCGVYVHEEYGDDVFFVKQKPTLKWRFYSPIGMTDLKMEQLAPEQQEEQKAFDTYVGR